MVHHLSKWVDPDQHGWVIHPRSADDWHALAAEYGGKEPTPLTRALETVQVAGCQTVVVENRYVDSDYRSEFSAFWSQRFQGTPAFSRRLHFFRTRVTDEDLHRISADAGYLGYAVIRPLPSGPLGRTMIAPPPAMSKAILALADDEVTLFGNRLQISAAPFCQQDGEFLRCAHAAAWMCHYAAARRKLVGRRQTATLVAAAPAMLSAERALPSKGMTLLQLQAVFEALEQPALFYGLAKMPRVAGVDDPSPPPEEDGVAVPPGKWDTRIFSVVCRYLNSGFPVFIATEDHAFVIVGWYREGDWIRFIANDDQRGPYQVIDSPFEDERGTWQAIMVPLPPRVFLSAEAAESEAHFTLRALGNNASVLPEWQAIARGVADNSISLRTILRDASDYKRELENRGLDEAAIRLLRLARLPHYVWVVEAHDRAARDAAKPCVLAEVVFDSTSNDYEPRVDALLMPTLAITYPPDYGEPLAVAMGAGCWGSCLPVAVPDIPGELQHAI